MFNITVKNLIISSRKRLIKQKKFFTLISKTNIDLVYNYVANNPYSSVTEIWQSLNLRQDVTSTLLSDLRDLKLVKFVKNGKRSEYITIPENFKLFRSEIERHHMLLKEEADFNTKYYK